MFGNIYNKSIAKKYITELNKIISLLTLGFFEQITVIIKLIGVKKPNGINSN